MRSGRVLAVALAVWTVSAAPVAAQNVEPAVDDLRDFNVTYEDGALTAEELDQLDELTRRLQQDGGYFKVVALGEPVSDFSSGRDFADSVREGLGGDGRVFVYSQNEVAVSSNVDDSGEVDAAERAAADTINDGRSLDAAVAAAAEQLGVEPGGRGGEVSGIPWGFIFLVFVIPLGLLLLMWWMSRRQRARYEELSAEEIGAAETTVRGTVDKVANDLLELADRVDQPGAPEQAGDEFSAGAELFTATQAELEEADTREELEAVYPRVVEAGWHLDSARALLDGQPVPARPEPEPLFPPEVVTVPAGVGAGGDGAEPGADVPSVPEPNYRGSGASPWITAAAMAAMAMLAQRGMATPSTRPSMDDSSFGSWTTGLPSFPSFGSSGRGRGGMVVPSGRTRGRGMGRR
jgi:hypothetical protein